MLCRGGSFDGLWDPGLLGIITITVFISQDLVLGKEMFQISD